MTAVSTAQALPAPTAGKDLFGHPRGLAYLAFAEAWERFSFYGMQALLVLYMVDQALRPGHVEHIAGFAALRAGLEALFGPLSPQALASEIFGLYAGFVYFTPVFGGLVGDRWLGQRKTVVLGAGLMALGHGLMAIEAALLPALLLLIVGCGCLKGNISAQVGNLYAAGDRRRADAFSVFNVGINVGAFAAPLVCGALGEVFGWSVGFAAAALGMLFGLAIYVAGFRHLPPDTVRRRRGAEMVRPKLAAGDLRTIAALIVVLVLGNFFSIAYYQEADVFPLWARDFADRRLFGVVVPVTWFQALDGLFTVAFTPLVLGIWRRQTRRGAEPGDLGKIAIGSAIGAAAMGLLAVASLLARAHGRASMGWSVGCFALFAIGFLYQWPTTLALISRAAPPAVNSTMMGAAFLAPFCANLVVGWLGGLYEKLPHATFWLLHAAISAFGALVILAAFRPLTRLLTPRPAEASVPMDPRGRPPSGRRRDQKPVN